VRLTVAGCRKRQGLLLSRISPLGVEVAVLADPKHVLYLTGYQTPDAMESAAVLRDSGKCILVAPPCDEDLAVDEYIVYEPSFLYSLRLDQPLAVAQKVDGILDSTRRPAGLDKGGASGLLGELVKGAVDLDPVLAEMRRAKDEDELAIMKKAIDVTHSCYARAREIIEPGITELEVYTELYGTAVKDAGEKLPALGNDFQCNSPGGAPRDRRTKAGELYILDLGVCLAGYHADNSRTFAVDGEPDEFQHAAWSDICEVFSMVEEEVSPGVSCTELFEAVKSFLDIRWPGSFNHHLGHGVGLNPHEMPNLNPHWKHSFQEGDLFTVEPGIYGPKLRGGIRLEENYLVTSDGVEKLTSFPLDL